MSFVYFTITFLGLTSSHALRLASSESFVTKTHYEDAFPLEDPAMAAYIRASAVNYNVSPETVKEIQELFTTFVKKNGGKASILVIGDSTMSVAFFLEKWIAKKVEGLDIQLTGNKGCVQDQLYNLNPPPTAILYGVGLHVLHLHPAQSCLDGAKMKGGVVAPPDSEQLRGTDQSKLKGNKDCGMYNDMVREAAEYFAKEAPSSQLIWKTTNSVCSDAFKGAFKEEIQKWHDQSRRQEMEETCRAACPARYAREDRVCGDEIYDRHSTELQRNTTYDALKPFPNVKILDAFKITDNQCDKTDTEDGRHYVGLDPEVARALVNLLMSEK